MTKQISDKIKNAKILIVEDDAMLVGFMKDKFKRDGMTNLDIAVYAEEAIEKIKAKKPDVILLDLILPKKDGFELLKEIRGDAEIKNIPVIIVSNLTSAEDKEKARKLEIDDFLVKSECDPSEIIERTIEVLEKYLS